MTAFSSPWSEKSSFLSPEKMEACLRRSFSPADDQVTSLHISPDIKKNTRWWLLLAFAITERRSFSRRRQKEGKDDREPDFSGNVCENNVSGTCAEQLAISNPVTYAGSFAKFVGNTFLPALFPSQEFLANENFSEVIRFLKGKNFES